MSNYNTLAPEVETPHAKDFRVALLKQLTEQHGPDYVRSERPELLYAAEVVNGAISAFGMEWLEHHYPAHAKHYRAKSALLDDFFDDAVTAELQRIQRRAAKVPAPVPTEKSVPVPVVAETETPKVSVTTDCLMPDIAPAFRGFDALPAPNSGRAFTAADDENLIQQRIADLEWLHRRGHRVEIDSHEAAGGRARHLLTSEKFDRDLAREVAACRLLSGDSFVAALYLPEWLEAEMAQLCTKSMKMKRLRARRNRPKVEAKLRAGVAPKHRNHVARWLDVHHCMALVGDSPSAIARLYTAMTGAKMSKSTACEARNEVQKRVG